MQAIIYNPDSSPVANVVVKYIRSVQASDYAGRQDVILYDTPGDPADVSALLTAGVPMRLWKVSGGTVVELTQTDKDAVAAADAQAALESQLASISESQSYYHWSKSPTSLLNATKFKPIL